MSDQQPTERIDVTASAPGARPGSTAGHEHDPLRVARQWFNQSDNVLMAITAVVAVVFLLLVGALAP